MKNTYAFFVIIILMLGFRQSAVAQCSEIAFTINNFEPCKFRVGYDNSNDACYTEIRLQLEQGSYANWTLNTAAGFEVEVVSQSQLSITHTSGIIPFGAFVPITFELPPGLTTPMYVAYINACPPGTGCGLFPAPVLESCPDPQDASISGVKYVECGNLPYQNQPTVPGWPIQLLDGLGNVLAETITDNTGTYAFYDLPAGDYECREADSSGWTANVPPTGMYAVTLSASQQTVRNFGNCYIFGSISGIAYETCVPEPYMDQPILAEVPLELLDASGAFLAETLTDGSGTYTFADLPPGNYYVKKKSKENWALRIPPEGFAGVVLKEQENEVVHFGICKNVCTCNSVALESDAAKGFAVIRNGSSCKTCFSPLALKHCDEVEWSINGGSTVGSQVGVRSFCHDFTAAGSYTVTMTVVRRDSDGNICAEATYSKTITVTCGSNTNCNDSVFDNPGFGEGAVAGGINSTGASSGWYGSCGEPIVVEGEAGTNDGWTIQLTGFLDSADVLASIEPMCVNKGSGTIALRYGIKEKGIKSTLHIELYQGPDFEMEDCDGIACFELANIDLSPFDTGWLELELPYDLSGWAALDTCPDGGLLVRPAIFVTSDESALLPGAKSTRVHVDNFCMPQSTCAVQITQCPGNITLVDCDNSGNEVIATYPVTSTYTGDCFTHQLVQHTGPAPGTTVPVGSYLITFQAEGYNASNNQVSTDLCSFQIHVIQDLLPPVFTYCPPDVSFQCAYDITTGLCVIPVYWQLPEAEDVAPCDPDNLFPLTSQPIQPGAFISPGVTTVVYTATDLSLNVTICSFNITVTSISSTEEYLSEQYPLRIHPNPTTNDITVKLPQPTTSGMQLRITGAAGNTLLTLNLAPGTTEQPVRLDGLPGGLYFLQITSEGRVLAARKLVKL